MNMNKYEVELKDLYKAALCAALQGGQTGVEAHDTACHTVRRYTQENEDGLFFYNASVMAGEAE